MQSNDRAQISPLPPREKRRTCRGWSRMPSSSCTTDRRPWSSLRLSARGGASRRDLSKSNRSENPRAGTEERTGSRERIAEEEDVFEAARAAKRAAGAEGGPSAARFADGALRAADFAAGREEERKRSAAERALGRRGRRESIAVLVVLG